MKRIMRQTIFCAFLGFILTGCSDEVLERSGGDGEGRLIFSGLTVEAVVGDIQTKASLEADVIPEEGDFTLTVVEANTSKVVKTLPVGTTDCFLPAGSYKVRATYGDEVAMSDTPYFFGESDVVVIKKNVDATVSLTASLACAVLHPVIDPQLEAQYDTYTLTVMESTTGKNTGTGILQNGQDFFVRGGEERTYTLLLAGKNMLGDPVSHSWDYSDLVVRTRYTINCNPDLPSFTPPAQSDGDVWSKFIYITPMTADNMTAHPEMADKVIANVVYEASADNGETWIPSDKISDGRYVIKGLEPSKNYTIRSRFGGVLSSNTQTVTTESAQGIANGDMEAWSSTKLHSGNGTWDADMYCDYCTNWNTRNEKTTNGAENANSGGILGLNEGSGYGVRWRWCSGTWSTTDKKDGEKAAEISTLAFYNKNVSGSWKRPSVYSYTRDNGTAYVGYLFTGTFDKNSDSYSLGIAHTARPKSISFDYKYAPLPSTDQCIAYAKIYDSNNVEIATTQEFNSMAQDVYKKEKLNFTYTQSTTKAAYIGIFFQSGTNTDIGNMQQVEGGYPRSPWNQDRVVGSVLKIDNVTLNYDYE